ncbi:type IV toxin-antitoxin system AbiEi family antitoxin domain-containing protein [Agromyces sp. Marseille-P2726]|uniref:type IV toxin-antitoxin system AbiEi family antitoxin domain-containing protein n=1 Tax=Agromyces sp. Marseille-P2726 TaxID=2709132 RepID=UPI00156D9456|nr:type IV toxin-antitoxin system AbiEi family antitoxin domain-containing protein [Agromyces sp. Marseille-P2726]
MHSEFLTTKEGFVLARDARAAGLASSLAAAVSDGALERVRRGVYRAPLPSDPALSRPQRAALRYRAQVMAAPHTMRSPIFTSYSAAVIHGLPIIGEWPAEVYVMAPDRHGHRRRTAVSVARIGEFAVASVDGVVVTSVEHTLIQLCRHASLGAALVAVDAALRAMPWETTTPSTTIERLTAEHERLRPYAGSRRTDAVLRRATSLADTPLETCSRLVMEEFGVPEPTLQHRLWLPELGEWGYLDFYWPQFDAGGEADGDGKYLGGGSGAASARTVVREKKRGAAARRRLRAFDRWDWPEMWARTPLVHRLRRLGLPVGARRLRLF